MTGPELVVAPQDEDAQPWSSLEGAGVVSSAADAWGSEGPGQVAATLGGVRLDVLGAAVSPLDALGAAGVGYLIEHLWFLHEPLDALAGDPTQITAQSRTWRCVSDELHRLAARHRGQVVGTAGWEGSTRDAYARSAAAYADRLDAAGAQADELAALLLGTGVAVATERALIRDIIAEFAWQLVEWFLAVALPAVVTAGAALAAYVTLAVLRGLELAGRLARRVAQLLDALAASAASAGTLAARFRDLAERADRAVAPAGLRGLGAYSGLERAGAATRTGIAQARAATLAPLGSLARIAHGQLEAVPAAEAVELAKQTAGAERGREEWEQGRAAGT